MVIERFPDNRFLPGDEIRKEFEKLKRAVASGTTIDEPTPEEPDEWNHIRPIEENPEALKYKNSRPDLYE
jgi:hypothetical protein